MSIKNIKKAVFKQIKILLSIIYFNIFLSINLDHLNTDLLIFI